jgi:hypothetical protein
MDLLEATQPDVKRRIGDTDCTFKLLTAYDRAELLRADLAERQAAWKSQRAELVENLKLAEITGAQAFTELENFRESAPQSVTEQDWIDYVNDPTKEVLILAASLRETHGDKAEGLARRARLSLTEKAIICGLQIIAREQETTDPNPQTAIPSSYGTPEQTSTGSTPAA